MRESQEEEEQRAIVVVFYQNISPDERQDRYLLVAPHLELASVDGKRLAKVEGRAPTLSPCPGPGSFSSVFCHPGHSKNIDNVNSFLKGGSEINF